MIRHAQADSLSLRLNQSTRYLSRRLEHKGVRAGRGMPQESISRVIHMSVCAQLRKIPAHQRKIVVLLQGADTPDAFHRFFIAQLAAQRVGRIGGIHNHATTLNNAHSLLNQSCLWRLWMNRKKLAHKRSQTPRPAGISDVSMPRPAP